MTFRSTRRQIATAVVDLLDAGKSSKEVAAQVAAYLEEIGKTRDIDLLIRDIQLELERRHGLVAAKVISARELKKELHDKIEEYIKDATNAKVVEMIETVDEGVIGGVVVETADAGMDASIRTKLRKLRSI